MTFSKINKNIKMTPKIPKNQKKIKKSFKEASNKKYQKANYS